MASFNTTAQQPQTKSTSIHDLRDYGEPTTKNNWDAIQKFQPKSDSSVHIYQYPTSADNMSRNGDITMGDASAPQELETQQNDTVLEALNAAQNVRVLPGSQDQAASFEFTGEDHTLGNALRWIIMKNPNVEFCGYSIPHPSEPKMNIRIQTYEGTAFEALEKGFDDLADLCDIVGAKFSEAREAFGQQA